MPVRRRTVSAASCRDPAVEAFLAELKHPLKAGVAAVRELILSADPAIGEGIKWNAPSFRTTEFFATFHLRPQDKVQLILHLGAKARQLPAGGLQVPDPEGLLQWLGKGRATVVFSSVAEIERRRAALTALIQAWIGQV